MRAAPAKDGPRSLPSSLVDFPKMLGETHVDAGDVAKSYPIPGTSMRTRRHPTAERLNVREPSRARTETGSRGEYDTAFQTDPPALGVGRRSGGEWTGRGGA